MIKRLLIYPLLAFACLASAHTSTTLDSLLTVLENEISRSDIYTARKQAAIDSLCALRPMTDELTLCIAREYQHFQADSSRIWYLKLQSADDPVYSQAFIGIAKLLASSGHHSDAIALLHDANAPSIRSVEGYKMAWLLYVDAAANCQMPMIQKQQEEQAQHYYDSMMMVLKEEAPYSQESDLWYQLYCASDRRDYREAIRCNEQLLALLTPEDHMYAILAYGNATLYEQAGDFTKRREWLVRSAITDVRCGITDNGSSWIVAQDCYDAGDFRRAYCFSDYSLTNATFFNAPTRFIQNFTPGHLIANRYEYEQHRAAVRLFFVLVLLAVVLIVLVIAVIYSVRQNRKLQGLYEELCVANTKLTESNNVKEQYICRYLEVYSDYIRRLTTMARKAGEKDTSAFMDREMENFYRSFDDTFLSLYGSFVQDFNALLKPEARITPKPGERLTVEMRIFALILLGITSSAKIAELLCYSPNTISNYRVKIKNNALGDRETFEQRIQQIRTLS